MPLFNLLKEVAMVIKTRPEVIKACVKSLKDKLDGAITQAELERRMRSLEIGQLEIFK